MKLNVVVQAVVFAQRVCGGRGVAWPPSLKVTGQDAGQNTLDPSQVFTSRGVYKQMGEVKASAPKQMGLLVP